MIMIISQSNTDDPSDLMIMIVSHSNTDNPSRLKTDHLPVGEIAEEVGADQHPHHVHALHRRSQPRAVAHELVLATDGVER